MEHFLAYYYNRFDFESKNENKKDFCINIVKRQIRRKHGSCCKLWLTLTYNGNNVHSSCFLQSISLLRIHTHTIFAKKNNKCTKQGRNEITITTP